MPVTFGQFSEANRKRCESPQGFKHPHDAIWLANGDIAVCTWNPGRLGYWRRLAPAGQ